MEDDAEKEFSLRENIADLKKEENILLGVVNDHQVEHFIDEPGRNIKIIQEKYSFYFVFHQCVCTRSDKAKH